MADKPSRLSKLTRAVQARAYRALDRAESIREPALGVLTSSPVKQATELFDLAKWRVRQSSYNLDYCPKGLSAPFMSARQALAMIEPHQYVLSSGFGATGRCSIFFWGLRDLYRKSAYPHSLNWMSVSAQGGRGLVPGTVEELAEPGLLHSYLCGHLESAHALLELAQQGQLNVGSLPQGIMAQLLELQGQGVEHLWSTVGVGCFFDPRVGNGSCVVGDTPQLIQARGKRLKYTLPKVDVAMLAASYADKLGNIYFDDLPTISEHREAAAAAYANGGKVLVTVAGLCEHRPDEIAIPASQVTAVVVNPLQEQIVGIRLRNAWKGFLPNTDVDAQAMMERLRLINNAAMVAAPRGAVEKMMSAAAADLVVNCPRNTGIANVGVGIPEEVVRDVQKDVRSHNLTFTSEAGVYGGKPGAGMFFGTAIQPERIESSAWMFKLYAKGLDVAVLGFLQVDSQGNVNVSHRGDQPNEFVGAGGFCDITEAAQTIVFVGSWMVQGQYRVKQGNLNMVCQGKPKFVEQVDYVSFNAQRALDQGKQVYYVSNVGVFKLTQKGVELQSLMSGIDLQKDVLDISQANIVYDEKRFQ